VVRDLRSLLRRLSNVVAEAVVDVAIPRYVSGKASIFDTYSNSVRNAKR